VDVFLKLGLVQGLETQLPETGVRNGADRNGLTVVSKAHCCLGQGRNGTEPTLASDKSPTVVTQHDSVEKAFADDGGGKIFLCSFIKRSPLPILWHDDVG
jgi:hypothetical protein